VAAMLKQKMDGMRANRARWKLYSQVTFVTSADIFIPTKDNIVAENEPRIKVENTLSFRAE